MRDSLQLNLRGPSSGLHGIALVLRSPVPLLVLGVLLLLAPVFLMPLSLVMRYRAGTARRRARGWVAAVNIGGLALSIALFLAGAAITNIWVPRTLAYSVLGLAGGCVLGVIGLWITRWEPTYEGLHYTPNRWLVLAVTLVFTARVLYGFWRGWHAWRAAPGEASWLAAFGIAGSLAAGALVLGYYLAYWTGVRRRLRRHGAAG